MRPICVTCKTFYRPEKNGVFFTEMADDGPYRIWSGDLWKCPGCGGSIIVGVGRAPVSEHFAPDFEGVRKRCGADKLEIGASKTVTPTKNAALLAMLGECAEYLENHSDVVDGSYGEPAPNRAMSLLTEVKRVLDEAGQ